ncbi:MAG: MoaD/ThiS family protein [Anaerolineae bacterium]|nr:MoaD/ThiS family protein [Anaerolineae bacterium]
MVIVWIPSLLRRLTGGKAELRAELRADGATVREVIDQLEQTYPGLKARLVEDGRLKPSFAVVVDGVSSDLGLRQTLALNSELHFVPALSGGKEVESAKC